MGCGLVGIVRIAAVVVGRVNMLVSAAGVVDVGGAEKHCSAPKHLRHS